MADDITEFPIPAKTPGEVLPVTDPVEADEAIVVRSGSLGRTTWALMRAFFLAILNGGTEGQVLGKASGDDLDLAWIDAPSGSGVPAGGTPGQVLTKTGSGDGEFGWAEGVPGPPGEDGSPGIAEAPEDGKQYARKDAAWVEVAGSRMGQVEVFDEDYMTAGSINYVTGSSPVTVEWPELEGVSDGVETTLTNRCDEGVTVFVPTPAFGDGPTFLSTNQGYSPYDGAGPGDSITAVKIGDAWVLKSCSIAQAAGGSAANPTAFVALAANTAIPEDADDPIQASLASGGQAYQKSPGFLGTFEIDGAEATTGVTGDLVFIPDADKDYLVQFFGTLYSNTDGPTGVMLKPATGIGASAQANMNGTNDCPIVGGRVIRGVAGPFTFVSFQEPGSGAEASTSYGFVIQITQIGA